MEIISGSGDINADIEKFCATFSPLLAENHRFLVSSAHITCAFGLICSTYYKGEQFIIQLSTCRLASAWMILRHHDTVHSIDDTNSAYTQTSDLPSTQHKKQ